MAVAVLNGIIVCIFVSRDRGDERLWPIFPWRYRRLFGEWQMQHAVTYLLLFIRNSVFCQQTNKRSWISPETAYLESTFLWWNTEAKLFIWQNHKHKTCDRCQSSFFFSCYKLRRSFFGWLDASPHKRRDKADLFWAENFFFSFLAWVRSQPNVKWR